MKLTARGGHLLRSKSIFRRGRRSPQLMRDALGSRGRHMKLLATLVLLTAPFCACSNPREHADPLRLDGRRLQVGIDSFIVYLLRGSDTTRIGQVSDELRSDGDRLIRLYRQDDRIFGVMTD